MRTQTLFRLMMVMMVMLLPILLFPTGGSAQEAAPAISAAPDQPNALMIIMGILLAISEGLALIPRLKPNGILHLVILILQKILNKPALSVVLLVILLPLLPGCGKTLDQIKQVAHQAIDVAGKVYEDVKDNVDTAKKTLSSDPAPAPPKP